MRGVRIPDPAYVNSLGRCAGRDRMRGRWRNPIRDFQMDGAAQTIPAVSPNRFDGESRPISCGGANTSLTRAIDTGAARSALRPDPGVPHMPPRYGATKTLRPKVVRRPRPTAGRRITRSVASDRETSSAVGQCESDLLYRAAQACRSRSPTRMTRFWLRWKHGVRL